MEHTPGHSVQPQPALALGTAPEVTLPLLPPHFQFRRPPPAAGAADKTNLRSAVQEGDPPTSANCLTPFPRGVGGRRGVRAESMPSQGRAKANKQSRSHLQSPERVLRGELGWGREAALQLRLRMASVAGRGGRCLPEGRGQPAARAPRGQRRAWQEGSEGSGGCGPRARGPGTHVLLKTPPRALPSRRQSCCEKKTQEIWGSELCVWQRRSSSVGPRKAMHRPKLKKTLQ